MRHRSPSSCAGFAAGAVCLCLCLAAGRAAAQGAPLEPRKLPVVELIDTEERISGNAATGIVLTSGPLDIGADRLWAWLPSPESASAPDAVRLQISSIDGRYYAEVEYDASRPGNGARAGEWVPLNLPLPKFDFLESYDAQHEVAALLSEIDGPHLYPLRWGPSHAPRDAAPVAPAGTDRLRVYMNTERASAFVAVDDETVYCSEVSAVSGFKFNAICDFPLAGVTYPKDAPADGGPTAVVEGFEVYRRSGTRAPTAITLNLHVAY